MTTPSAQSVKVELHDVYQAIHDLQDGNAKHDFFTIVAGCVDFLLALFGMVVHENG